MRTLSTLFGLLLLMLCPMGVWADCSYPGGFTLEGSMGNGINFSIHAAFWGDNPCIVVGETVYKRQNGKTSSIPLYGKITDENCFLEEIIDGKVCGRFVIEMPGPGELQDIDNYVGQKVTGSWMKGEKEYPFNEVKLANYQGLKGGICYDDYLHHTSVDYRHMSGKYGSYDIYEPGDTIYNYLEIVADTAGVKWNADGYNGMCDWRVAFATPGLDADFFDQQNRCFKPKVDDGEYEMVAMDDALMLYRTNALPEETDNFVDLRGVYPKLADYVVMHVTRQLDEYDPECVSYYDMDLRIPRTDNPRLNKGIRAWICEHLGYADSGKNDYWTLAEEVAKGFLKDECNLPEKDEDGKYQLWQLAWRVSNVRYSEVKGAKYLNLEFFGSYYGGGTHPFSHTQTSTLRRSDGKVMGYNDWFVNPDAIRPIVEKYMREQNAEVEFDGEQLALPDDAPYFLSGNFGFKYGQYEAAPYCYGMPSCEIPLNVLLPYLTEGAKKLVK